MRNEASHDWNVAQEMTAMPFFPEITDITIFGLPNYEQEYDYERRMAQKAEEIMMAMITCCKLSYQRFS